MVIERDYENDYFPVFRIDLCLNTELYHKAETFNANEIYYYLNEFGVL